MRAVVIEAFGEPGEVLAVREVPSEPLRRGEVRVRMLASPINPSDLMTIRGIYGQRPALPATPGYEGVGIVRESGGGMLGRWLKGRRVAVLNRQGGSWATESIVPARQCVPLPEELPLEQAAMFFVNPATAYVMIRHVLNVPHDAWLIQSAAGGSLGQMIIRLGKHYGFRTINVVRREDQVKPLRDIGADSVIVFDDSKDDPSQLVEAARQATGGVRIEFAIDPVGGTIGTGVLQSLGEHGRMLVFGSLADQPTMFSPREVLTKVLRIEGFWLAKWFASATLPTRLRTVRTVSRLIREGVLVNDVGRSFRLDEVKEAVQHSEMPGRGGKSWLKIAD